MGYNYGNKFALGNKGGRPPKYETADELTDAVISYFEYIEGDLKEEIPYENIITGQLEIRKVWEREPEPPTITGLALFLGFESRQSMYDYEKGDEFSYIIKRARTIIENGYELDLRGKFSTGAIFALKNMNWADKVDHNVKSTNVNMDLTNVAPHEIKSYRDAIEKEY